MKYTTVIAASMAAGVSADNWNQWSESSTVADASTTSSVEATYYSCPDKVTQTQTVTADCAEVTSEIYSTTITVEAPATATVTVYEDGKTAEAAWEEWTATSEAAEPTSLPAGCVPQVVTETATEYNTQTGSTTTAYKSTLFVGAGYGAAETVTITAAGAAPTSAWGSWAPGNGNDNGNNNGNNDNGNGNDNGYGNGNGDQNGWGNGNGGNNVATKSYFTINPETWTVPIVSNTFTYEAPAYTQRPDGSYGGHWGDWNGPGNGNSPGKNNGSSGYNETAGSPASNVTKPIFSLEQGGWGDHHGFGGYDHSCNNAGDRSKWCNGKDIDSDYYQDYFSGKTCTADLTLTSVTMDYDGTPIAALAFNGQVPGPLIECNWGDIISVTVHNNLADNGTAIHWHGFRQVGTNDMDGVPGVTECPLAPGESKTYTFHASSYGTTWYHSHWLSQYGDGVYGPIIIHGPATTNYDEDMGVVAIHDTYNRTAEQMNDLIAHTGPQGTANYLLNGHNTKADLTSGQHTLWSVEAGKKYLFRFVNTAAQNMYSVSLDNHKMTVIAGDFVPITPYETEWLNIGIGQRYDVVIEMDQKVDSYFLRAVTQTGCPSSCDNTGLGNANGIVAYKGVQTSPYLLPTSSTTKTLSDFAICDDEPLASLVPHLVKDAGSKTSFQASASSIPAGVPKGLPTSDDGTVFQWFLNNNALNINYTDPTLEILAENGKNGNISAISNPIILHQKNEWVYFVIQNQFFASHPMHLHGHDFSLLGQGEGLFDVNTQADSLNFANPMRRDTAMLKGAAPGPPAPTGYTVIGFQTDNPGAWLMHCHIIWHVDGGLAVQWIERPEDITTEKYVDASFKETCAAYENYEATHPGAGKKSWESGLKKRTFFDEQVAKIMGNQFDDVVRRSDSGAKRYVDNMHLKRVVGDAHHPRHFGRK